MKEALFYKKINDSIVQCELCPHYCTINDGKKGKCNVRENKNGKLYSLVYGKAIATAVDPIEKKPLAHFMPGSMSYSIATVGCNFHCKFCQNFEISQPKKILGKQISAEKIVDNAIEKGCKSIAYTYTEPTIFYEYVYDIAKQASLKGIKNIFVTNGYINPEPLKKISKYLDAANIDLKSMNHNFYEKKIGANLQPVLDSIKLYHKLKIFLEITTLIIPGHNDSDEELNEIAEFISSIDKNIPWHVSRFYPMYKMDDTKPTPEETLIKAVEIGKKHGLKYIYAGNLPGNDYESTYCSKCNKKLIDRYQFMISHDEVIDGKCSFCNEPINIVR